MRALLPNSAAAAPWARTASEPPHLNKPAIKRLLDSTVASGALHGVAAMVASREEVLFQDASGVRTLGQAAPMSLDTVMWIASMSKAITAAAAMQCVERGQISLDDPVQRVVPEIADVPVLQGFDAQGVPQLRAPRQAITLRHLLTHVSGFSYEFFDANTARYFKAKGIPGAISATPDTLMRPLVDDPGQRWEYGIGLDWAGRVVEALSDQRLGDYLRQHLFEPLAMSSTGFRLTARQRERQAGMHRRRDDGSLSAMAFETPQDPAYDMGGHALYSTPSDYLRFLRMLLCGGTLDGQRVLQEATVAMMGRNQLQGQRVRPFIASADKRLSNDVAFAADIDWTWGLSFMINAQRTAQGRSAGSWFWGGLCNSYWWIDPDAGIAAVLMTQVLPFFDAPTVQLLADFEAEVYRGLD